MKSEQLFLVQNRGSHFVGTRVGKSRFSEVCMEKDLQVGIIYMIYILVVYSVSLTHNCKLTFAYPCVYKTDESGFYDIYSLKKTTYVTNYEILKIRYYFFSEEADCGLIDTNWH